MIWFMFVTFVSFIVKGLCGFANTMVFTTLLSFGGSVMQHIMPVNLLLNYPTNVIMAWKDRKSLNRSVWLPLSIMVVVGTIPGTIFFKNTDTRWIEIIFGVMVILSVLDMMFRKSKPAVAEGKIDWKMGILGVLAGFVTGFCGIGVLVGTYVSKATDDTHAFKANACLVYFIGDTVKLLMYLLLDLLSVEILLESLMLYPAVVLGLWLGMKVSSLLKEAAVKKFVMIMLFLSGLALILTNL
ncbi:MAG: sulfite exporter TauE/SafE family protein [Clostridia bacterium]|nr:sulfite exporter TauE/SafE family protein [Clostridia bacterium]